MGHITLSRTTVPEMNRSETLISCSDMSMLKCLTKKWMNITYIYIYIYIYICISFIHSQIYIHILKEKSHILSSENFIISHFIIWLYVLELNKNAKKGKTIIAAYFLKIELKVYFFGELRKTQTEEKLAVETWQRKSTMFSW